jgi:hypothetical protein
MTTNAATKEVRHRSTDMQREITDGVRLVIRSPPKLIIVLLIKAGPDLRGQHFCNADA